ncbi:venom phosphodiesterase 2-like isoform X2 [Narcine bancroftii]|uniref:venom phosphodiesterase 2-like isoform X2 n=1 Tax=Narcine bancroftii TaxID=1343680 RepID=UPI0038312ECC
MDLERGNAACGARYSNVEQRASMLPAPVAAERSERSRWKSCKYRVLIAVLLALLFILLLGLGLGLGLQSCHDSAAYSWTCGPSRCGEKRLKECRCSCSDDCIQKKDCCTDYNTICLKSWLQEDCEDVATPQCPPGYTQPPVILISLDGFQAGYFQKWKSRVPVLNKLRTCGVQTPHLIPVYPTKTFPNHYSIITGLYPESHGVIDNKMYDVDMNASFNIQGKEKNNPLWYKGQPLWLTAKYQGLKTGTFFWVGSESKINGSYPDFYKLFDRSIPFEERVFTILKWLDLPKEDRPDFYALYLEEPDFSGHRGGPNSQKLANALEKVDAMVAMLMDGLKQRNLQQCVNLIVISDHGMEEVNCSKVAYMDDYLDSIENITMRSGSAPRIRTSNVPEDYFKFDSEGVVKKLTCRSPDQHFKPYLKHHLPKRLHYASSRRIEDVHLYMDPQWQATLKRPFKYCTGGFHGSDNLYKNMQAIFVGHGPGFKVKTEVQPFANIEVYNLICDLLNITPAPNNGTHGSLNHLLKKPVYTPTYLKEASAASRCFSSNLRPTINPQMRCTCSSLVSLPGSACEELQLSLDEAKVVDSIHLPFGWPRVVQENCKWCLLRQHSYVTGYKHDIQMPLWSSYTIFKNKSSLFYLTNIQNCVLDDVRIPLTTNYSSYTGEHNITPVFLYPPNLLSDHYQFEGLFTSNRVPMYTAFQKIWNYLHNILVIRALHMDVNVISGPVFDFDFNGRFDTPSLIAENAKATHILIPTHYYIILTNCKNKMQSSLQCEGSLDVLAFILPHRPDNTESCAEGKDESQWIEERIWAHRARVLDVELITGLDFYQESKQPISEILQLKTFLQFKEL